MHCANYMPEYPDRLKTKRQWALCGFSPKEGVTGTTYWINGYCKVQAVYYSADEVIPESEEYLAEFWRPILEKKALEKELRRRRNQIKKATREPSIPCDNRTGIIVLDTETTGLETEFDEILQLSIIDGTGNVLFHSFVQPVFHYNWPDAVKIHGITPEMIKNAPGPEKFIPVIKGIFASAKKVIGYNVWFDLAFLARWGIYPYDGCKIIDVMQKFAHVYGEWDANYGSYRWQRLSVAADFYGFSYHAHDSLEDAKATLHVYRKMMEDKK